MRNRCARAAPKGGGQNGIPPSCSVIQSSDWSVVTGGCRFAIAGYVAVRRRGPSLSSQPAQRRCQQADGAATRALVADPRARSGAPGAAPASPRRLLPARSTVECGDAHFHGRSSRRAATSSQSGTALRRRSARGGGRPQRTTSLTGRPPRRAATSPSLPALPASRDLSVPARAGLRRSASPTRGSRRRRRRLSRHRASLPQVGLRVLHRGPRRRPAAHPGARPTWCSTRATGAYLDADDAHPRHPDVIPSRDAYTQPSGVWIGSGTAARSGSRSTRVAVHAAQGPAPAAPMSPLLAVRRGRPRRAPARPGACARRLRAAHAQRPALDHPCVQRRVRVPGLLG